jgi:predicted Zn-dependent protease
MFIGQGLFSGITLGHEVGHVAGIVGHRDENLAIMAASNWAESNDGAGGAAARRFLNQAEADKFEGN